MTPNWTPEDLIMAQERVKLNMRRPSVEPLTGEDLDTPDPGPESELASKIVAQGKANGWPTLSFPQSEMVKRFLPPGWPDIVQALPLGRTIWLETKSATGELSEKQRLMCNMFRMLGHEYYKCKSFKRWVQIVERKTK